MREEQPAPVSDDFEILHALEADLGEPQFRGIPIGPSLADLINIEVVGAPGVLDLRRRWKDRARRLRYWLRPQYRRPAHLSAVLQGKILVTRLDNSARLVDLTMPVLVQLGADKCRVLCKRNDSLPLLPSGVQGIAWNSVMHCDAKACARTSAAAGRSGKRNCVARAGVLASRKAPLKHYRCNRSWQARISPPASLFLENCRPAAIVTEFDRNCLWSSLILVARALRIPTFGFVHGVADRRANPMVPVLADKLFAWSEVHRQRFINTGEDPQRIVVGGCPRITRTLSVKPAEARASLAWTSTDPW